MLHLIKLNGVLRGTDPYSCDFIERMVEGEIRQLDESGKRSNQANNYLWGVLYESLADAMGEHDIEYIHEVCKRKFIPKISASGEVYGGSTAKLSKKDFKTYCDAVEHLIFDIGGHILKQHESEYVAYKKGGNQ